MIVRNLIVIFISVCVVAEPVDFHLEPVDFVDIKSHDGIRSYPVLKVSFYNPKNSKKMTLKTQKDEKSSKLIKSDKIKSDQIDNVRERLPISSREDMKKMKKLSFHGRSPPIAISFKDESPSNNTTKHLAPIQLDFKQRKYTQIVPSKVQSGTDRKASASKKVARPHDKGGGFLPLMRPSPINVQPVDPPSFQTMRNYVDYLKLRQKQFFSDLDESKSSSQKVPEEVDYFVKREQELAEEQRPKTENLLTDVHDVEHRSEINDVDDNDSSDDEKDEENYEEESRRKEKFVPFRMYAQVRHVETENHKPRLEAPSPKVTEKLSLEKKNVYYKEEGYEEKDYDHGDEKIDHKYRSKRSAQEIENLPVAVALIKKTDLPKLTGEKLLKHLDELLKKSEIFLPDDDDDDFEVQRRDKKSPKDTATSSSVRSYKSQKFPYYALPDSTLNTMSAFRYSENLKNFPRAKESLYKLKNIKACEEIDQEPEPVPSDIEEKGKSTNYNEKPRRLKNLGDKIGCYKEKYFGKDPLDNPLFKEEYVAASVPIPFKDASFISHQANPLITVYDDVISNIRAAFADDLRKKKEQENLATTTQNTNAAKITESKIPLNLNLNSGSRLPIFDITNFQPKLNVSPNNESTARKTITDYEMEFIEIPKNYQNKQSAVKGPTSVITNLRPPNLATEKRRRRNPVPLPIPINNFKYPIPRNYPALIDSRPSHFLQPPITVDRNRFKLL